MSSTRFSTSICFAPTLADRSGLLVRIYPQAGIGEPFEVADREIIVGREAAEITLSDDSVSRRHASIHWNGQAHIVTDLNSTNGTYVNECRVERYTLQVGDRVRFGNQLFKYMSASCIESQYHEMVFKIMTTDGLTQAHNKSYFLECFHRELHMAQRSALPLSVLMLDLDHFKSINDTFGHLAGDQVLVEFAARLRDVLRQGDLLARYGGEEFAILCGHTSLEHALALGERLRQAVSAKPVLFNGHTIDMTVSIGIAEFSTSRSDEPTSFAAEQLATVLLAEADQWLYKAKQRGRNQVACCLPMEAASHAMVAPGNFYSQSLSNDLTKR